MSDAISGGVWSSGSGSVATVGSGSGVVTGAGPGTATITYTLAATGCGSTTYPVTVNPLPAAIGGTLITCGNSTTTLTDASTGGAWTSLSSNVSVNPSTGGVTGVSNGTAIITYTLPTTCLITAVVTDNPTPIISGASPFIVCGASTTQLSLIAGVTGGTWSSSTGSVTVNSTTGLVTGVSPGSSTITYTTPGSGCSATQPVTDNPIPVITSTTSFIVCGISTTTLNVSPGITGGTWLSSPSATTIDLNTGVLTGVTPGVSTIVYTTPGSGCFAFQAVTDNPTPAITGTTSFIVCGANTTTLNVSPGITTGTWSSSNISFAAINSTTGLVTGVSPGTSTITYTTPGAGCSTTQVVTDNPTPVITGTTSFIVCGANTTTLNVSPGITTGTWASGTPSNLTIGSGTGVLAGVNPGTSTITYTTTGAGCSATQAVTDNPTPGITGTTSFIVCGLNTTTLNVSPGITTGTWPAAHLVI